MTQDLLNHKTKCRLCFQRISGTRNITKITDSVKQKFFSLTNIELKSSDKFSNHTCKPCFKSLNETSEFQTKMIDNQLRLYAFEGEADAPVVKAEPIESSSIELQEFSIENVFLPKTEVFDDTCTYDETSDSSESAEVSRPASPDNDSTHEDGSSTKLESPKLKSYTAQQVEEGLEAIKNSQMSILQASNQFNVPQSTLRAKAKNYVIPVTFGKTIYPTEDEELHVRIFVKNLAETGIDCTKEDIVSFAAIVLKERDGNHNFAVSALAADWFETFQTYYGGFSEVQVDRGFTHCCDVCGFATSKKNDLRIHMTYHAETQPKAPRVYNLSKHSALNLEMALRIISKGSITVTHASKIFTISSRTLYSHLEARNMTIAEVENFECSYCGLSFPDSRTGRMHEVWHLKPADEFRCKHCIKVFKQRQQLTIHYQTAHRVGREMPQNCLKCKVCDKVFDKRYDLTQHASSHKSKIPCEICGMMVNKNKSLHKHLRAHGPGQFRCTFAGCSKAYHLKTGLKYHIENTHAPKQNVKCAKCDKPFPNEGRLRFHMDRSHAKPRCFCAVDGCSYKSTRMEYLKLHLRNHRDIDEKLRDELILRLPGRGESRIVLT